MELIEVIQNPTTVEVIGSPTPVVVERLAGSRGEPGPQGIRGEAATINVGTVATGAAGSNVSVINSGTTADAVFDFTIPRGNAATIAVGTVTTGAASSPASVVNSGTSGDAVFDFTIPQGIQGIQGEAATIAVGTVTTGAAGSTASITNSGTSGDAVFNFTIPRGDTGKAATIAIGTVSTGAPGSTATVTNSGTAEDGIFNFSIPRGDTGATGPAGPANTLTVGTVSSTDTAPQVTISGTSPNQVIDFVLQRGPVGPEGPQGPKGDPGSVDTVNGKVGPDVVLAAADVNAEPAFGAGTTGQYLRGDKVWTTLDKAAVGLGNVDNTSDLNKPVSNATQSALNAKANSADLAAVALSGSASDITTGTLPTSVLPPLAISDVFTVASETEMLALNAQKGDMAVRTDTGTTFVLSAEPASTLANWKEVLAAGQVQSVAGKTGVVSLVPADVGLGNVDNTSDMNKPVSTAQQTALDGKENTIAAGTTAQYYRGDKTWQALTKAAVGLGNVDNTSDLNKPVSTATQTALDGKANTSHNHAASNITSGTLDIARLPVALSGTSNTTQVVRADDARLSNARTPTAHVHAASDISTGTLDIARIPTSTSAVATAVVRADDARLSDARTPTAHTHVKADITDFAHTHAAADVTSGVFAAARLGSGTANSTTFLRGDNTWAVVATGANLARVIYSGSAYPARPDVDYVEWVGPVLPPEMVDGDTWVDNS